MNRPASPEVRLAQAVVCQAFLDAVMTLPEIPTIESLLPAANGMRRVAMSRRNEHVKARRESAVAQVEAREWLLSDSEDFRDVCDYADLDADNILEQAKRLAALNWPNLKPDETQEIQSVSIAA